jgi:hypothetical protein
MMENSTPATSSGLEFRDWKSAPDTQTEICIWQNMYLLTLFHSVLRYYPILHVLDTYMNEAVPDYHHSVKTSGGVNA